MTAAVTDMAPQRVADEEIYEVLRDEWNLLLAIGTGPTERSIVLERLGARPDDLDERLQLLVDVGLAERTDGGRYATIPAIHQRQEGMSSCLRDLVIKRLQFGLEEPLTYLVRSSLGEPTDMREIIRRLNDDVLAEAYSLGSVQADSQSKRYLMVFGAATSTHANPIVSSAEDETTEPIYRLIRQAAIERSSLETKEAAKLWIADVHVNERVAVRMGQLFEDFLTDLPARGGAGSAGFVIIESEPKDDV